MSPKEQKSEVDLFVVGGGINGCGIARDAAGRGLRVELAEMNDLASETSSASTKLLTSSTESLTPTNQSLSSLSIRFYAPRFGPETAPMRR